MRNIAMIGLIALAVGCGSKAPDVAEGSGVRLETVWRASGFAQPESVASSADRAILYVTNVAGDPSEADGKGFISTVDAATGKVLQQEWVSGLNAPKGVARMGASLYVADINEIVVIDLLEAKIVARHPVDGADFLNDVAALSDGTVLVSDSGAGRIYQLTGGVVSLFAEGPELARVNGLFPADRRQIIVATMEGKLLDLDRFSRAITPLAEGLDRADAVIPLRKGRYLVSAWPGLVQVVEGDGSSSILIDSREEGRRMNDGLRVDDMIYMPHMEPGELTAYRVTETPPAATSGAK